MEVRNVDVIPLSHPLSDGRSLGSSRGQTDHRFATLVRLETADGTLGWGEALAPPRTVSAYIDEHLVDLVHGLEPVNVESLADTHYVRSAEFSGAYSQCALSAVDMALWDLKGKEFGYPVSKLLAGRSREELTPYASTMYVTSWEQDPEEPIREAAAEGFTAAKVKIGRGVEDDIHRVRTAREILGEEAHLMVDFNGNYRATQALEAIQALREYDLTWVEEPVSAENLDGYRELSRHVEIPLAAGEGHYGRFEFADLIDVVDIVQPNLGRCGGFSEGRFIADLAMTKDVAVHPHVWNSGVGIAAAVQFAAGLSDYPQLDNVTEPRFLEFDRSENPLRDDILVDPFDPTGGSLEVPQKPGLGIEIDEEALETYRLDH